MEDSEEAVSISWEKSVSTFATPVTYLYPTTRTQQCLCIGQIRINKSIILGVVLYGCETWSLILKEEHRLRVFENRVLRIIFGLKRDEVTRSWRKLHNEEHSKCRIDKGLIKMG
jgi:hypothetical protein